MKNPAAIEKPKLKSPALMGKEIRSGKKKRDKGTLPYLRHRRKLRRNIFGR